MTNTTTHINHRHTFGNATAGQAIAQVVRHLVADETKAGVCGIVPAPYALYRTYAVATRIEQAQVCGECLARA